MNKKVVGVLAGLAVVAAAAGWWWRPGAEAARNPSARPASAASSGAPVAVVTTLAERRDFPVVLQATGTVTPLNKVELRPQVSSTVRKVHIREGQTVKAGQLLFSLDSRSDEAAVAKAEAQLRRNQAALADAQRQLARSRELLAQDFISRSAVDTSQGAVDALAAAVAADRAALDEARVGLSYSRITAPSAGRVGAIDVFAGSLVQPSSPPLATITQLDPIAVAFSLPQRHLGDALGTLRQDRGVVEALLPEGGEPLRGKLQFVDNEVDAGSGSVRVKAVFGNRQEKLWPGAFVNVRLAVQMLQDAIVVPQAAVVQGARGRLVFVVEDGKAASRPVELVHAAGSEAVITGLPAGARVVLEGRHNLRPGVAVIERPAAHAAGAASRPHRGASAPGPSGFGSAPPP